MSDTENLLDTIKANSDQLNACDIPQPITVTIQAVSRGKSKEQPVRVDLDGGYQPWYPCKTVRRILIAAWGENGSSWVGKSAVLYCDESVKYGGVSIGGIRVSHLSDISGDLILGVNLTRGKKGQVTVKRLEVKYYPDAEFKEKLPAMLKAMQDGKMTREQVIARCEKTGKLTDAQKEQIK